MNQASTIKNSVASGVSLKAVSIGLLVMAINAYWISVNDLVIGPAHNYMSLFSNAVFSLFVLILANLLLKKLSPRFAFTASDLLVIYIMVVMVTTVSGHRMTRLLGILVHPFWFATPENDWRNLFWSHIPEWFTVGDKTALSGFFLGESSFFTRQHIAAWLGPMFYWSAFIFVVYFVLICVNTIVQKQFTEHERLTYPITWLPLEMGQDTSTFLKNKLMWMGFGIAAGISLLNGLHTFYPFVPPIPVGWQPLAFEDKPWIYMGRTLVSFQPFVIGLAFFMPLDLAFSAWFFYILKKMTQVLMGVSGWHTLYFDEQAQGAWVGLGILALWIGRRHLKWVVTQAVTGKPATDDSSAPMQYRTACWGIMAGLLVLIWFAYKSGLSLWALLLFWGIYGCGAIGVTKIRSGLGLPVHEMLWIDPARTMVTAMGTRIFAPRNLTVLSFFYWLNREQVAHPMPNQLEAFRIGEQSKIDNRKLLQVIILTLAVGIPVTFVIYLSYLYKLGAVSSGSYIVGIGRESFTWRLQPWLSLPTTHDYFTMSAMGLGFGITGFLLAMKMRFLWWPFHPVGYVLGVSPGEMVYVWVPVLVSWALKFTILRYGGLKAYRSAIPFFAGLILGDYSMGCIWSIISAVFKITVPYNLTRFRSA